MFKDLTDAELRKLEKQLESGLYHTIDYWGGQAGMRQDVSTLLWEIYSEKNRRFKFSGSNT